MPIVFPPSPATGDQITVAGVVYEFDGQSWISLGSGGGPVVSPFPPATQQYQVLQADATLAWVPSQQLFSGNF